MADSLFGQDYEPAGQAQLEVTVRARSASCAVFSGHKWRQQKQICKTTMKKHTKKETKKVLLTAALGAAAACNTHAYDLTLGTNIPPITVHGTASQGYLLSSDYNYLANDTKNGSFQFSEFGLNVSMNPFPRTRVAVQGFDFDVGNAGQYDPFLDYALIEYTFNDKVGLRAGRIRRPAGIYNDIQDIDLARTFVLLPQGMYDARWRDWSAGLDGAEVFGDIQLPTHKLGDISYAFYAGQVEMQENGGIARYIDGTGMAMVSTLDDCPAYGGQLWYNTPVDGLRFGASISYLANFGFTVSSGGVLAHSIGDSLTQQYSAEYLWKNWTFQAEFQTYDYTGKTHYSLSFIPEGSSNDNPDSWYGAVSYRFNKHVQAGTYYSAWVDAGQKQNDIAVSLRLDLTDWWVFKVEGHAIEGTGLLRDMVDNPHTSNNSYWYMLAVKTTFSF